MRIEKIGSFKAITEKLEKKGDGMADFVYKTALLLNGKIQIRVQNKGLGSDDKPMKKYSTKYSLRKSLTGRQSKFRNLTFSGNMFQSLTAEKMSNNQAKMFFGGAEDKAKAFYNDKETPFFSLSPNEQDFLKKELEGFAKV